jgi:predicted MPP superfamily phosphohydrolase
MKRRTFIPVISVFSTILIAECLVYIYLLRFLTSFNIHILKHLYQITYWAVLPLFMTVFFLIWKKYYKSQSAAFSGKMFRIAGLFVLIYIPKILLASTIVLQYLLTWSYQFSLLLIKSYHFSADAIITESPFNLIPLIGVCISGIAFVIILFGITLGRFQFRLKKINLTFEKLPGHFNGFKAIQISDLHTGSVSRNIYRFKKLVRMINNEKPDLIFFTGDVVNEFAGELAGWEEFFSQLKARYGKFSVPGNHDYGDYYPWKSIEDKENNIRKIIDFETGMGFRVLLNESVSIKIDGQKIDILGVENWGLKMFKRYGRLDRALEKADNTGFKILLSHDPSHWDAEVAGSTNIDLTLSGHTHGFQFGIRTRWFRWSPVKRFYPRWEGLHRMGDQYLYINTGLGYIGFPGRIGIPPEITIINLFTGSPDL